MAHPRARLETPRLLLRQLAASDATAIERLAGDPEVARSTADLPVPFDEEAAATWLATQEELRNEDRMYVFGLEEKAMAGVLIGAIGLTVERAHGRAELGFWLGRPWWKKGYAVEAGRAILVFAFQELELDRVFASHLAANERSGRVLSRLGFRIEGRLRRHVRRFGDLHDVVWVGLLADEWAAMVGAA